VKKSRFKRAMRSIMKYLGDCFMWMGCASPYYVDPRFLSEERMSAGTEAGDQATPRSPADAMAKSPRWRKSA
jgi:hypothetical protein